MDIENYLGHRVKIPSLRNTHERRTYVFISNDKLDFVSVDKQETKSGFVLKPELSVIKRDCLMTRGHTFYAVWDFEYEMWSFDELRVPILINHIVQEVFNNLPEHEKQFTTISDIGRFRTSEWSSFKAYCKQLPDKSRDLDTEVTFADEHPSREDYRARKLPYALSRKQPRAYLKLMNVLYDPEELEKLEWSVGLCLCGEQSLVHKFVSIFGGSGTGKSTYLNVIDMLFRGYTETVNVHNIVTGTNDFALSRFASNPLVIIEHDCNLSTIRDNSRLNSMISHEKMEINVKNQSMYTARILGMLFLGTNKPIHITDARSGIARRLIDVSPSGRLVPLDTYDKLMCDVEYELGAIAYRCINVYRALGRGYYGSYVPIKMLVKTNVIYSFVLENANELDDINGVTLTRAFNLYKKYCEDYSIKTPMDKTEFRDEIEEYFLEVTVAGGGKYQTQVIYKGLNPKMLKYDQYVSSTEAKRTPRALTVTDEQAPELLEQDSLLDELRSDCKAQYTNTDGTPLLKWTDVTTTLSSVNSRELHWLRLPKEHIVVDLDIKGPDGEKSLGPNLEAAKTFPETYMEVSKSGNGLHLHYIYDGDVSLLDRCPEPNIEVKVFTGNGSLRRKLTLCNNTPIATISSGLKLKEKKVTPIHQIKDERHLRSLITKGLKKEVHAATRPSIDFIKKTVEDAVAAGLLFDVTDLYPQMIVFAAGSTNQSDYCVEVVRNLLPKLSTLPEQANIEGNPDEDLLIYDIEVFPNLYMFSYALISVDEIKEAIPSGKLSKKEMNGHLQRLVANIRGSNRIKTLINPTAEELSPFLSLKTVGFNNRKYDNHELYGRCMGETNAQSYLRSRAIIDGGRDVMRDGYIPSAWNLSYLDIYDLATTKQSLKKWEVMLKLPHVESDLPWDRDVPEEKWAEIEEYNQNDVLANICVLAYLVHVGDFAAREILANMSGLPFGTTLRNHFAEIIFEGNKNPQSEFIYSDLSETFPGYTFEVYETEVKDDVVKHKVKSEYQDTDPSEGGRVYTEPGVYDDVALFDIKSMHPASIIALNLFGTHYTQRYKAIRDIRVALKDSLDLKIKPATYLKQVAESEANEHNRDIYGAALAIVMQYEDDVGMVKHIVTALKLGLNSTYGWTSASFPNPFRDPRNVDNIVAKRGALFMIALQHELQSRGISVVHVKTDSIKIPGATAEVKQFIDEFAAKYQFEFAHEDTYRRMCLINKAIYICYSNTHDKWEATGAQFAHPIVFKKLFSHEPLEFDDYVEVKEVKGAIYMSYDGESLDRFIGRIGTFVAVKNNGGHILRVANGKKGHVQGTKGFGWEESDAVLQSDTVIDWAYYNSLITAASAEIEKYMPLTTFVQFEEMPFTGAYLNI